MSFGRILQQLRVARRRRLTAMSSSIARALKSMLAGESSARRGKSPANGFGAALDSLEIRQVLSATPLLMPGESFSHDAVPDSPDRILEIAEPVEDASQFPGEDLAAEWSRIEQDTNVQQFRDQLTLVLESLQDGTDSTSDDDAWRQLIAGDWNSTVLIAPEADSSFNPLLPLNTTAKSVIEIEFDWSEQTQSFRVTPITSGGFRIELLGLGSTSLAEFDAELVGQVVRRQAESLLTSIPPAEPVSIVFRNEVEILWILTDRGTKDIESSVDGQSSPMPDTRLEFQDPVTGPDQAVDSWDFTTSGLEASNDLEPTIDEPSLPSVLIDQLFDGSGLLDRLSGIADQRPTSSPAESPLFANSEPAPSTLIFNPQHERSLAGPAHRSVALSFAVTETSWWQRSAAIRLLTRGWEWLRPPSWLQVETGFPGTVAISNAIPALCLGYGDRSSGRTTSENPDGGPASTRKAVGQGKVSKTWPTEEESLLFPVLSDASPLLSATAAPPCTELASGASPVVVRRMRDGNRQGFGEKVLESIVRSNDEPPDRIETDSYPRELKYVVNPRAPPSGSRDPELRVVVEEASADLLRRLRYSIAPRGPSLVTVEMQSPEFLSFSGPRVSSEVRLRVLVG